MKVSKLSDAYKVLMTEAGENNVSNGGRLQYVEIKGLGVTTQVYLPYYQ